MDTQKLRTWLLIGVEPTYLMLYLSKENGGEVKMRVFWTVFWSLLLINMLSYVVANMVGDTYNYMLASTVAIVFSVIVMLIGEALPNEPVEKH
jgi:hypothetical protein